jgi:hypothetical protein
VFRPDSFAFHAVATSYSSIALRCVGVNHHFGGPAVRNAIVTKKAPASRRDFCWCAGHDRELQDAIANGPRECATDDGLRVLRQGKYCRQSPTVKPVCPARHIRHSSAIRIEKTARHQPAG